MLQARVHTQNRLWPGKAATSSSSHTARLETGTAHLLVNNPGDMKEAVAVGWNLSTGPVSKDFSPLPLPSSHDSQVATSCFGTIHDTLPPGVGYHFVSLLCRNYAMVWLRFHICSCKFIQAMMPGFCSPYSNRIAELSSNSPGIKKQLRRPLCLSRRLELSPV